MKMYDYNPELVRQLTEVGLQEQEAIDCLRVCWTIHTHLLNRYYQGSVLTITITGLK